MRTARPPTPPRENKKPRLDEPTALTASAGEVPQQVHPLVALMDALDDPDDDSGGVPDDFGTWAGNWPLPSRTEFYKRAVDREDAAAGLQPFPVSATSVWEWQACAAATARREIPWRSMNEEKRREFQKAAEKHWAVWLENEAVRVLSASETARVREELRQKGEEDRIIGARFVLTDKNDGLRTESKWLPLEASARIVIPGYKVKENIEDTVRRDAPTGSRNSQHALFILAGCHPSWRLAKGDVRAAFLKGDPYAATGGKLYMTAPDPSQGPKLPGLYGVMAEVLKGVFGLADAPRGWFLRLDRCMKEKR